ncbi:MAG TPA: ParB/RepB/Spo0J family partition protein, partial [Chthoniobacterales bacterium]
MHAKAMKTRTPKPARSTPEIPNGATPAFELLHLPLSQLVPSPLNVRQTARDAALPQLVASLRTHGLLQNLSVLPEAGPEGQPTGRFEVVAGGRRLAALTQLAQAGEIPPTFAVPCRLLDRTDAQERSLAENVIREAMHPADEFLAFRELTEQGVGTEAVAARFGVTALYVRQRLKLAQVSPVLFARYRAGDLTLDQLMALTVSADHAAQERAWNDAEAHPWQRQPHALRSALTQGKVHATDPRARLVGLDAYLAAGGGLERDLFQAGHDGYLDDPALLDRLVAEKLETVAASIRAEGWKWVEVSAKLDHARLATLGRIRPVTVPLAPELQAEREALQAEQAELDEAHGDECPWPDEATTQLERIETRLEAIREQTWQFRDEDKACAGAVVSVEPDGEPCVLRGFVRKEDQRQLASAAGHTGNGNGNGAESNAHDEDENRPGFSGALVEDLTAQRTAALRAL